MTGLDSAIRNAIDRAGAGDAGARRRIYDAARQAFEKGIDNHPELDTEAAEAQRRRFETIVRDIEAEKTGAGVAVEAPAADESTVRLDGRSNPNGLPPPDAPAIVSVQPDRQDARPAGPVPYPDVAAERARTSDHAASEGTAPEIDTREDYAAATSDADFPALDEEDRSREPDAAEAPAGPEETPKAKRVKATRKEKRGLKRKTRRRRGGGRVLSAVFLLVSLFVFIALGLWLLNASGLVDPSVSAGGPNSFTKFDSARNGGTPDLVTGNGFGRAWTPIAVPGADDANAMQPGATAEARPIDSERGKAVRLTSATAGADGDIRITVSAEILRQMAGKAATIALNMRGVAGQTTHIAIECDFAGMGGCNRRRFEVNPEMTDVVFRVDEKKAAVAGKPGYLLINTDIDGKGRSVDLFAVGLRNDDQDGQ